MESRAYVTRYEPAVFWSCPLHPFAGAVVLTTIDARGVTLHDPDCPECGRSLLGDLDASVDQLRGVDAQHSLDVIKAAREVLAEIPNLDTIPSPHAAYDDEGFPEHDEDCHVCAAYRLLEALADAARAFGRYDKASVGEMLTAVEQSVASGRLAASDLRHGRPS